MTENNLPPAPAAPACACLGAADAAGLISRLIVGGIFMYSGYLKAVSPAEEFAFAIESYKIVPPALALLTALTLPWLELFLGTLLLAGLFTRFCAAALGLMLLGFEALLAQAWLRGLPILSCGCFGANGSNSLAQEFAQNIPLLILSILAFKFSKACSLDSAAERYD